ncbi:MAG: hypothetical protein WKF84_09495 [Pyrinomonadaceae bacterium]
MGIVPALQATKPDLVPALKDQSSLGGFRRSRLRNALVAGQMALSLLLLDLRGADAPQPSASKHDQSRLSG